MRRLWAPDMKLRNGIRSRQVLRTCRSEVVLGTSARVLILNAGSMASAIVVSPLCTMLRWVAN